MSSFDPEYEPRLFDADGDMSKRWYIDYKIWDTDKQAFVRKQYTGMNKHTNLRARRKAAFKALDEITAMVKEGATTGTQPVAEVNIKAITVKQAVNYFLNKRNASPSGLEQDDTYNKTASFKKNTFESYKSARNNLFTWLEKRKITNIRFIDFGLSQANSFFDYLKEEKQLDDKTYNNYLGCLRTVFDFYVKRELLTKNPLLKVERKQNKKKSNSHVPFTNEQMRLIKEKIMEKGDHQLLLFISFIYYTFARPEEEVRLLQIKDIRENTTFIPGSRAKGNRGDHVEIPAGLERLIEEHKLRSYPPHYYVFTNDKKPGLKPVGKEYFYERHRVILKNLGLTDQKYTIYGYKHTGAINLYIATKDIKAVQRQCRHATSTQTDTYLRDLGVIRNEVALQIPEF